MQGRHGQDFLSAAARASAGPHWEKIMTPLETVSSIIEAIGRRDIGNVLGQLAPDVTWVGPRTVPWGGEHNGPAGVQAFFMTLAEHIEISAFKVHAMVADGGNVTVFGAFECKGCKTGKTAASDFCWARQVENGKVSRYQGYFDTAAILAAVG